MSSILLSFRLFKPLSFPTGNITVTEDAFTELKVLVLEIRPECVTIEVIHTQGFVVFGRLILYINYASLQLTEKIRPESMQETLSFTNFLTQNFKNLIA